MKNIILLTKQGIKAILTQKLHLIVIFVLVLFSGSMFTAGMSAVDKMNKDYNSVFQNTPPFDYTYNYQVGKTAKLSSQKYYIASYMDLMPEYTAFNNSNSYIKSTYNLFLGNYDNYNKQGSKNYLDYIDYTQGIIDKTKYQSLNYIDQIYINSNNKLVYNSKFNAASWVKSGYNFQQNIQNSLIQSLEEYKKTKSENGNFNNTLLKKYFLYYYNSLNTKTKGIDSSKIASNFINNYGNGMIKQYISDIYQNIINYLNSVVNSFYDDVFALLNTSSLDAKIKNKDINDKQKLINTEAAKVMKEKIKINANSTFVKLATAGKMFKLNNSTSDINIFCKDYASVIFTWLTGENLGVQTDADVSNMIGTYNYDLNGIVKPIDNTTLTSLNDIYFHGFRGMISPPIYNQNNKRYSAYQKYHSLVLPNDLTDFKFNLINTNTMEGYYLLHQLMAANASGFNLQLRNELFLTTKSVNNRDSFRIISLYKNNNSKLNYYKNHLKIINGYMPTKSNEIAISPQFARKNHWTLGSSHSFYSSTFIVTAYATDPYSFMPSSSYNDPIPKITTSANIFMANNVLSTFNDDNKLAQQYTNIFLTSKNKNISPSKEIQNYYSYLSNNISDVKNAIQYYQNNNYQYDSNVSAFSATQFNQSNYKYNWTIPKLLIKELQTIYLIVAAILLFLALISSLISVNRSIKNNSLQIGILKSLGLSNRQLSFSYISYAIFIILLVIPISWVIGSLMQIPLLGLFNNFFSFNYTYININVISLAILEGVIGGFMLLVTFTTSLILLSKKVILIINNKNIGKQNRWLEKIRMKYGLKFKFPTRFKLSILGSSLKQITLMSCLIFIASVFITVSLTLPNFISNVSNSFYKNLNYKNDFIYNNPTYNSPFSNMTSTVWEGNKELSKKFKINGGFPLIKNNKVYYNDGYDSPWDYQASLSNNSIIPMIVYDASNIKNHWQWAFHYEVGPRSSSGDKNIANFVADVFGNNIFEGNGGDFSVGLINSALKFTYLDTTNPKDLNNVRLVNKFYNQFASGMPNILATILNQKIKDKTKNWEQQINQLLLALAPPFVAQYVNSTPSRNQQFTFGWNSQMIDPTNEEFSTTSNLSYKNSIIKIIGMKKSRPLYTNSDKTQNALDLNNMFGNQSDYNKIKMLSQYLNLYDLGIKNPITQDIVLSNGQKIYNSKTHTLTIPVVANKQAGAKLGVNKKNTIIPYNFRPTENSLYYLNNQNNKVNMPKIFWAYNDTDFANSNLKNKNSNFNDYLKDQDIKKDNYYWKDPYNLDDNKMSVARFYKQNADNTSYTVNDNSYAFVDNYKDKNNNNQPFVRPYYEYNNVYLYLPINATGDMSKYNVNLKSYLNPSNYGDYKKVTEIIDPSKNSELPPNIVNDFPNAKNTTWLKVSPFNVGFDKKYQKTTPISGALGNLTNHYRNWIDLAQTPNNNSNPLLGVQILNENKISTLNNLKIHYNVLDYIDTYGGATIFTNQKFANIINNFSIGEDYQYRFTRSTNLKPLTSTTPDKYKYYNINNNLENVIHGQGYQQYNHFWLNDTNALPTWYNSKYSSKLEPTDLVDGFNTTPIQKIGHYLPTTAHGGKYQSLNIVKSYNLYGEKRKLIDHITSICLSVSAVILFFVIVCSTLLILLINNLFVNQYEKFMFLMKTEGYKKTKIMNWTVNIFTPFILISWGIGSAVSYLISFLAYRYIYFDLKIAIPFVSTWWIFLISLIIIILIFSSVFLFTYKKLSKTENSLIEIKK